MGDGKTRVATIADISEGVILRSVDSEGYTYPFGDMVVTNVRYPNPVSVKGYYGPKETTFDCIRPYAFAHLGGELHSVERIRDLTAHSLASGRYHVVLTSKGEPYKCQIDR